MDYQKIIDKYYSEENDDLRRLLMKHSRQGADRCLQICDRHLELRIDREFVEEAAMLHDIGIRWCNAPSIHCHGTEPYLQHGPIGGALLRREGWERHARVAERHTGTGLPGLEPLSIACSAVHYNVAFLLTKGSDVKFLFSSMLISRQAVPVGWFVPLSHASTVFGETPI